MHPPSPHANPMCARHRLDLIQVALRRRAKPGIPLVPADLGPGDANQTLNPWTGELSSRFSLAASPGPVLVKTACHMELDILSWWVEAAQLAPSDTAGPDALAIRVAFPYGSGCSNCAGNDWSKDDAHTTTVVMVTPTTARLKRKLDFDEYEVLCQWSPGAVLTRDGPHAFVLALGNRNATVPATAGNATPAIRLSCLLSPGIGARYPVDGDSDWLTRKAAATREILSSGAVPLYDEVAAATATSWETFWESGAFVDLAGADGSHNDPRAHELERRVVLSQYLTRSQSAGSTPPQETGYTLNSWYGKHHHEMRWWHQTHFALWQRPALLQRSDGWFRAMLPNATSYAANQGYEGARWPKMVGPANTAQQLPAGADWRASAFVASSVGNTSYSDSKWPLLYWTGPSTTGPMLVWQQPHIIWMTELQRLHAETPADAAAIVASMTDVITATADFMASYPAPVPKGRPAGKKEGELWLGPPTDGGEEGNPQTETWNPTFELTYFRLGLKTATEWRQRAGLPPKASWAKALAGLAEPTVLPAKSGADAYAINANCWGFPQRDLKIEGKHRCSGAYGSHPLFLGALGMINGAAVSPPINPIIMNTTLALSIEGWDWVGTWGWDYPLWAFAQMRLGWSSSSVVDMMLRNETKNLYFANGHDYETPSLPCYLPGNGGLLSAVAMMAGGFADGAGKPTAVGFPPEWGASAEGFKTYP